MATTEHVLREVAKERERQNQLCADGLIPFNCNMLDISNGPKLTVLVEEIGEVARAMQGEGNLREELIQVASVAVAWAESLKP